jgi:hypothetical protein
VRHGARIQSVLYIVSHGFQTEYYDHDSRHFGRLTSVSGDYPLSNRYPSGPEENFSTQFHSCLVRAQISDTATLPS